jgi:hypothetical protein
MATRLRRRRLEATSRDRFNAVLRSLYEDMFLWLKEPATAPPPWPPAALRGQRT